MKKIIKVWSVFLVGFLICHNSIAAKIDLTTDATYTSAEYTTLISGSSPVNIKNSATITIYGDVTSDILHNILAGTTLIVYGDLELTDAGCDIKGNVIVTGIITLTDPTVFDGGNIVAGEGIVVEQGDAKDFKGDVYVLDPDGTVNGVPGGVDVGGVDELVVTDPDLVTDIETIVDASGPKTWDGSESTVWGLGDNWDSGTAPTLLDDVEIAAVTTSPVLSGSKTIGKLTVLTGATLTIAAGSEITVLGDLTIEGTGALIVNNTSGDPASVIVNGTVSGDATINWNSLADSRWWYMGYAVTTASVTLASGSKSYYYNNATLGWASGSATGGYDAIALKVGTGEQFSYSGELDYTTYSFDVTQSVGIYQTFANPYPAYLDLMAVYEDAGFAGFTSSYYLYTDNSGSYVTYNAASDVATGDISRYIAPGQSVWVLTDATSSSLPLNKSFCSHQADGSLKSTTALESDRIRLYLKNSDTNDETLILFKDFGSDFFTGYDSEKRMVGGKKGNIYTVKEDKYAVINSMPVISGEEIIPLGYKVSDSGMADFTIQVGDLSAFEPTASVYLEDIDEEVTVDLRQDREYTFTPTATQSDNRFVLRIVQQTTDIDEEVSKVSDRNVLVYTDAQNVTIKVKQELLKGVNRKAELYNLTGQLVESVEINNSATTMSLPQSKTIYIVKVTVDGYSYKQKVIGNN